jgi:RecA-family ATPase
MMNYVAEDLTVIPKFLDKRLAITEILPAQDHPNDDLHHHVAMLHKLASGIDGKLVLASFGEDPTTKESIHPKMFHFQIGDVDSMVAGALALNTEKHRNVYAPLAVMKAELPAGKKGHADDVVAVLGIVADFDLKDDPDAGRYAERLPIPPDFVVESSPGSFQTGYVFESPLPLADAKILAEKLAGHTGCDTRTKDPSGVWRLPGTKNWPNAKKVNAGRSTEPTDAVTVAAWSQSLTSKAKLLSSMPDVAEESSSLNISNVQMKSFISLPHDLDHLIRNGVGEGARSEQFHHAVGWLKQLGYDLSETVKLLEKYPNGIASKYSGRVYDEAKRCWSKVSDTSTTTQPECPCQHSPIDWSQCEGEPPQREWTWDNMVPRGHVTSLFGDGGAGKTLMAQQLGTCVATGCQQVESTLYGKSKIIPMKLFGKQIRKGPVICLFGEDDEDELWRRQDAINLHYGLTMNDIGDLHAMSGFGLDNILMSFDQSTGKSSALQQYILKMASDIKPELIIIDNIADTFAGKEADRSQANQFLKVALGSIVREYGCSILLLGHPSIAGMNTGSGFSGSTAWNNGVRSRLYMERMDKEATDYDADTRFLSLMKANYAAQGDALSVKWNDGVWSHVKDDTGIVAHLDAKQKRRAILKEMIFLISSNENLSPNSRAGTCASRRLLKSEPIYKIKLRKDEIEKHLDGLLRVEFIKIEEYRNNSKDCQRYTVTASGHEEAGE